MDKTRSVLGRLTLSLCLGSLLVLVQAQTPPAMSFFITSAGSGNGANLGGLAGADANCQKLAARRGRRQTWRAYLSTSAAGNQAAVNARDRIGKGPWQNAKGVRGRSRTWTTSTATRTSWARRTR